MKIVVAIPCYNCGPQITRVLEGVDDRLMARVEEFWIFDNGSLDDTVAQALRYKASGRIPKLRVFRNEQNVNLGGTHKIAFERAKTVGASHVAILHGDDQASTSELHILIDEAEAGETQTILGSRFNRRSRLHGYDWKRIAGNRVLNMIYSCGTLRRLEDLGSGINLFAVADLDRMSYMKMANSLTFNFELLLDLIRRRVHFTYVPITWEESDQVSNARNVSVFVTAVKVLIRWRIHFKGGKNNVPTYTYASTELV